MAWGVDVEPGDDILADGGIDFPIPLAIGGIGVRFPLSGGVNVASDPMLITYGHGLGPVDPFHDHPSLIYMQIKCVMVTEVIRRSVVLMVCVSLIYIK
jgi:hypothetical protein